MLLGLACLLPAAPSGALVFTDVTSSALPGLAPAMPRWGVGAAAGDYDGDGWIDLYFSHLGGLLYRNKGDGSFENVTPSVNLFPVVAHGAAWGDIDNDGDLDLYVAGSGERHFLFVNDGGTFSEEAVPRGASAGDGGPRNGHSASFGDYDNDGFLDIFVAERQEDTVNPDTVGPHGRLFRNRGSLQPGHFDDVTVSAGVVLDDIEGPWDGTFGFLARFSDLDADGLLDLAVIAEHEESRLFWNEGDGSFSDGTVAAGVGTDENGMGASTQDYDGDGWLDLFVTSIYQEGAPNVTGNRLFRNLGNRTFSDEAVAAGVVDGGWGWGSEFFDYDNDGDLDLAMANGFEIPGNPFFNSLFALDPLRLWRNEGGGSFSDVASSLSFVAPGLTYGLLAFDYDADGDLDVLITYLDENPPLLFRNDGGNGSDWLKVELVGRRSQIDGIGARITVTPVAGGPSRLWEMSASATSPSSQYSGTVAHFGLGPSSAPVAEVSVRWPSGAVSQLQDVAVNGLLQITEPAACDDTLDNDGDGQVDGLDPGCSDAADDDERSPALPCDDGLDNDGDGRSDFDPATFAAPGDALTPPAGTGDPGCKDPAWHREDPQCQDGGDNADPDALVDYDGGYSVTGLPGQPPDPECAGEPWKDSEGPAPCGLGSELSLLLPVLAGFLFRLRGGRRSAAGASPSG